MRKPTIEQLEKLLKRPPVKITIEVEVDPEIVYERPCLFREPPSLNGEGMKSRIVKIENAKGLNLIIIE